MQSWGTRPKPTAKSSLTERCLWEAGWMTFPPEAEWTHSMTKLKVGHSWVDRPKEGHLVLRNQLSSWRFQALWKTASSPHCLSHPLLHSPALFSFRAWASPFPTDLDKLEGLRRGGRGENSEGVRWRKIYLTVVPLYPWFHCPGFQLPMVNCNQKAANPPSDYAQKVSGSLKVCHSVYAIHLTSWPFTLIPVTT